MQEDTKPQKRRYSGQNRKEPLSCADYHNVIVAYVGVVLAMISLLFDVFQSFPHENIQILRVEDDGYYHFDGETLFKNFQVTVANNSAIPVSVLEITIERDGEAKTFEISDLPDILPLNMEEHYTEVIIIPWTIQLSGEDKSIIKKALEKFGESDIVCSSKIPTLSDSARTLGNKAYKATLSYMDNPQQYETVYLPGGGQIPYNLRSMVYFALTIFTAKRNTFSFKGKDYKPFMDSNTPLIQESEGHWVANQVSTELLA